MSFFLVQSITFGISIGLTAVNLIKERKEGLIDRTWVAGVNVTEIIIAQVVTQFFILLVQISLVVVVIVYGFKVSVCVCVHVCIRGVCVCVHVCVCVVCACVCMRGVCVHVCVCVVCVCVCVYVCDNFFPDIQQAY